MNILEKEIEDLIFESIENCPEELSKRGFPIESDSEDSRTFYLRQYNLGCYGIADIIGVNLFRYSGSKRINVKIYELKKDQVGPETFAQAGRYAKGIQRMLNVLFPGIDLITHFEFILIGKSVVTSDWIYLLDYIDNLNIYTYSIDLIEGVRFFRHRGYKITNETVGNVTKRALSGYKDSLRYFINNPAELLNW